jgi:hypothetical protein
MLRRGTCGRIGVLIAILALSACDHDQGDTSVASAADDDGDREGDDPNAARCAALSCGQDLVCVVPAARCDKSGPEPVVVQDDPYCAPLSAGPALVDPGIDAIAAAIAGDPQALCPSPDVLVTNDTKDGTMVVCPHLDDVPECH